MTSTSSLPEPARPDPATDHITGPADAIVTLIEYGDLECPSCRQAYSAVKAILERHARQVRFVFRHFPLREVHPHAELAAEAAEAAGAQHRFWPYYDLLLAHQEPLDAAHISRHARELGLDMPRFENELKDHVYLQRVQEHLASGQRAGVRATPTFFVNGRFVDVSFGLQKLQDAIDQALRV